MVIVVDLEEEVKLPYNVKYPFTSNSTQLEDVPNIKFEL